jgi:hypothetical protein
MGVNMYATKILQYMKIHGQKLDREIAKDTGISLIQVRITIAELQNLKEISSCSVINFENGVAIEGILCRFSGYIPPAAPGRKAAVQAIVA